MNRSILAMMLCVSSLPVLAHPLPSNPTVEVYQEIGTRLKTEPQLTQLAVIVNAMASLQCGRTASLGRVMDSRELKAVDTYIQDHGADGRASYQRTLDNAVFAVCDNTLAPLISVAPLPRQPRPYDDGPAPEVGVAAAILAPVITSIILGPGPGPR